MASLFERHKAHELIPLFLVVYMHNFVDELLNVPTLRVLEDAVCRQHYDERLGVPDDLEMQCKTELVQKKLLFLMSWLFSLENLPGKEMNKINLMHRIRTNGPRHRHRHFLGTCCRQVWTQGRLGRFLHRPSVGHAWSSSRW